MRARHRHFNPKDAGGSIALDSRFLSLNNNDAVTTWTSRTGGNNVTQSTGFLKPTFKTAIQGGQPIVRFVGDGGFSNQNYLTNTSLSQSQPFFVISTHIANTGSVAPYICDGPPSGLNRIVMSYDVSNYPLIWAGGTGVTESANRLSVWNILSGLYNTTSSILYRLGSQVATGSIGSNNWSTGITFGARTGGGNSLNGDIGNFMVIAGSNQSLRKRCEHSAAYSFKLACS